MTINLSAVKILEVCQALVNDLYCLLDKLNDRTRVVFRCGLELIIYYLLHHLEGWNSNELQNSLEFTSFNLLHHQEIIIHNLRQKSKGIVTFYSNVLLFY